MPLLAAAFGAPSDPPRRVHRTLGVPVTRLSATPVPRFMASRRASGARRLSRTAGLCLAAALTLLVPALPKQSGALRAQEEIKSLAATGSAFDISAVKTLVADRKSTRLNSSHSSVSRMPSSA